MTLVSPFGALAAFVVGWEATAALTEDLFAAGFLRWRAPYITEVVRATPYRARLAFTVIVAYVIHEHIEQMRLTNRVLPERLRQAAIPTLSHRGLG